MAHYAWLNENNIVINVTVGVDETELINGMDAEIFYSQTTGHNIKRTSYNSKIRGKYAGIGDTYNPDEDIFVTAQPYPSWIRSGSFWNPPIPRPKGENWNWDEASLNWVENETLSI
jgi:hypothetical protein